TRGAAPTRTRTAFPGRLARLAPNTRAALAAVRLAPTTREEPAGLGEHSPAHGVTADSTGTVSGTPGGSQVRTSQEARPTKGRASADRGSGAGDDLSRRGTQ